MHKLKPFIIIIIIAGAVGGGYWYFSQNPDQLTQLQLQLGLMTEAEATGVHTVSGFIETDEINVAAETPGRITRLTVDEGDSIQAGQLLVQLDMDLLNTEIRQAEAKIITAQAQLAKVKAGVRAEEIAIAEAAVAVAQANADAASTAWQDAITLRDNPQELEMQIDAARTALKLAELRIQAAIPQKDADEALWEAWRQRWEWMQEDHRFCRTHPLTGQKMCMTMEPEEAQKQDAGVAWNMAGADMWESWVDLNSAQAARDDAEIALNDLIQLRDNPQTAAVNVAQAEAAYKTALAEVSVAEAQLAQIKSGPRAEQIALAEAQVEQAQAALQSLQVQQDKHTLSAPVSGRVVEQLAHEGEMAVSGAALLTVANLAEVTLTVYVPEPDIDTVSIGQPINVYVDAFPGRAFTGHITYISDEAEFTPKNVQTREQRINTVFAVKIKLENEERLLKPGMPADAVLSVGEPEL